MDHAPHVMTLGSERKSSSEDDESEETLVMVSVPETWAEEAVVCQEDVEKTVDLSRDSEGGLGSECLGLNVLQEYGDVKKMEEDRRGASAGVVEPVVEGSHGSTLCADIELGVSSGGVRAGKLNSLQCIRTVNKGEGGAARNRQGSSRVRANKRNGGGKTGRGPGTCKGNSSLGADKGVNEQGIGDADDPSGKKPSQTNEKEEPTNEELTENLLKVLDFLAKQQRPTYKGKVDIIESAVSAGVTFPRPSWWPEHSDDDSN